MEDKVKERRARGRGTERQTDDRKIDRQVGGLIDTQREDLYLASELPELEGWMCETESCDWDLSKREVCMEVHHSTGSFMAVIRTDL